MTSKVYRHKPLSPDEYLGRVEPDGKVYETRFGPDRFVGRVETDTGKIYQAHVGPDRYIGRVELDTGKVYRTKLGPDEYLGRVDGDGHFHRHRPMAPDVYIGKIASMPSYAHGAAAYLLLALPAWEEHEGEKSKAEDAKDEAPGAAA
jgi:hypothetical protein